MLTIRPAAVDDVETLFELIMALARHENKEDFVFTSPERLRRSGFGPTPQFGALLAEVDGINAGFLSYTFDYTIWLGTEIFHIDDVFVRERFRGQGVGKALMLKAKEACLAAGQHSLRWAVSPKNQGAIRFYRRLGATYHEGGVFTWNPRASESESADE